MKKYVKKDRVGIKVRSGLGILPLFLAASVFSIFHLGRKVRTFFLKMANLQKVYNEKCYIINTEK